MKTLEQAIGCWTSNRQYNSLEIIADLVKESARGCRKATLKDDPMKLAGELELLSARLRTLTELNNDAMRRLTVIIQTGELQ